MLTKRYILHSLLCMAGISIKAQDSLGTWNARLKMFTYNFVEKMPAFLGGDMALVKCLNKIVYPKEQQDLQSRIDLSFVVDTAGNLLDKCILNKNESAYTLLDKACIALLNQMPKWIPGEQDGRKVAVRFYLPMRVCLREE